MGRKPKSKRRRRRKLQVKATPNQPGRRSQSWRSSVLNVTRSAQHELKRRPDLEKDVVRRALPSRTVQKLLQQRWPRLCKTWIERAVRLTLRLVASKMWIDREV